MSSPPSPAGFRAEPVVFAIALTLLLACASGKAFESDESPPPMTRHEGCAKTACDLERDDCQRDIESCNNTCIGGSIETFESCYEVCRGIDCPSCTPGESPCVVTGYRFSVTGDPEPALEAACERARARDVRCSEAIINPDCEHFSKIERPEAELAYRCHASTACDADTSSCLDALPTNQLGTELCRQSSRACVTALCDPDVVALFDATGRWLRERVTAEAFSCVHDSCDDTKACLRAWLEAAMNIDA